MTALRSRFDRLCRRWRRWRTLSAARMRGERGHLTPPMRATGPWAEQVRVVSRGGRARRAGKGRGPDGVPARPPGGIVAVCAVAVVALAALSTSGARWMRVAQVEVVGAHAADPARMRAALQGAMGAPLLLLDTDALRTVLLADPWVEQVQIARRLPRRLRVILKEARPVFVLPGGEAAVSSNGKVLPRRPEMDFDDLPELRVPVAADGSVLSQDASLAVRRLCAVLDRSPWTWSEGLCRVELDPALGVEFETSGGARVVLGREDWGKRMRSLSLAGELVRPGPGDRVDLRFERQIVLHPAYAPPEREEGES